MAASGKASAASGPTRSFGEELRARRKQRYPNARDFAGLIGISAMEVSRWEREVIRSSVIAFPDEPAQIRKISELLEWPLADMQRAAAETRRRLIEGPDGTTPGLRDIGILYAAGFAELTPRQQARYVSMIEEDAREAEEEGT